MCGGRVLRERGESMAHQCQQIQQTQAPDYFSETPTKLSQVLNPNVTEQGASSFFVNYVSLFIACGGAAAWAAKRKTSKMHFRDVSLLTGSVAGPTSIMRQNSLDLCRSTQYHMKRSLVNACRCLIPGCLGVALGNQVANNLLGMNSE